MASAVSRRAGPVDGRSRDSGVAVAGSAGSDRPGPRTGDAENEGEGPAGGAADASGATADGGSDPTRADRVNLIAAELEQVQAARSGPPAPPRRSSGFVGGGGAAAADLAAAILPPLAPDGESAVRRANAMVFLALMLIVLAFFIVMVAIAIPNRARQSVALGSVAATFAPSQAPGLADQPTAVDAGPAFNGVAMLAEIEAAFANRLEVIVLRRPGRGRVLTLAVGMDEVFFPATTSVRLEVRDLLSRVATTVAETADWTAVTVQVPSSDRNANARALAAARAGRLADILTTAGVDREAVSVGLRAADGFGSASAAIRFQFDVDADPPASREVDQ